MRDGWNFHGDIAISLESYARSYFKDIDRPTSKIYDADSIESGNFIEVMIILLRERTEFENEFIEIDDFVKECSRWIGKGGNEIEPETAEALFKRFVELYNEHTFIE